MIPCRLGWTGNVGQPSPDDDPDAIEVGERGRLARARDKRLSNVPERYAGSTISALEEASR
jgi:hypothetical protein